MRYFPKELNKFLVLHKTDVIYYQIKAFTFAQPLCIF